MKTLILFMSDEAYFHLNGMVNQQNYHYWTNVNPRQMHERPLHSPKVKVWYAVADSIDIGPYFFQDGNGNTVTVNGERYTRMITDFFIPELRRNRVPVSGTLIGLHVSPTCPCATISCGVT